MALNLVNESRPEIGYDLELRLTRSVRQWISLGLSESPDASRWKRLIWVDVGAEVSTNLDIRQCLAMLRNVGIALHSRSLGLCEVGHAHPLSPLP